MSEYPAETHKDHFSFFSFGLLSFTDLHFFFSYLMNYVKHKLFINVPHVLFSKNEVYQNNYLLFLSLYVTIISILSFMVTLSRMKSRIIVTGFNPGAIFFVKC